MTFSAKPQEEDKQQLKILNRWNKNEWSNVKQLSEIPWCGSGEIHMLMSLTLISVQIGFQISNDFSEYDEWIYINSCKHSGKQNI